MQQEQIIKNEVGINSRIRHPRIVQITALRIPKSLYSLYKNMLMDVA